MGAESKSDISFKEIQQHMQLNDDYEVEEFMIELLKTKLVRAKMDQQNKTVHVSSTMHRTFTSSHWAKLYSLLTAEKGNLQTIRKHLNLLVIGQQDLMRKTQQQQQIT